MVDKKCTGEVETFSRITGFYRPVQCWNIGKKCEFKNRKIYTIREDQLGPEPTEDGGDAEV